MEYVQLQQAVKSGSIVTDVEERNNRVYFKVNGFEFQTFGNYVYAKGSPIFDHPVTNIWARRENTPEGIAEEEKQNEEIDKDLELFHKHEASLYKLVFLRAFEKLKTKGEKEFLRYIHHHFDIMENDRNCQELLSLLEEANT